MKLIPTECAVKRCTARSISISGREPGHEQKDPHRAKAVGTDKGEKMAEELLLTQEGYDKLEAEHDELIAVKRAEISASIKEALAHGDISENAEFDAAKNEQAELEERVIKLEDMMRRAKIVDAASLAKGRVGIGMKAKIKDLDTKEEIEFSIVGATESNPAENKITNESPLGKGLIGKKIGETADIQVPDGLIRYKILDVYK